MRHGCNLDNPDLACVVISTDSKCHLAFLVGISMDTSISLPAKGMKDPLVDWWRKRDFQYTDEEAKKICQVQVKLKGKGHILSYPADKVWRKRAFDFEFDPNKAPDKYPFKDEV